ncbi:MAG: aldo/keto reductase [Armatimonadota bacterium]|nr:MAG: aldo/keto reductase [Armatimonadota bacterium]
MQYRDFGNTGVKVSLLGFGAMRLPENEKEAVAVMRRAYELGVNYFDTAPGYGHNGSSEVFVGKAIGDIRDKVYLSTKNPIEDASGDNFRKRLEDSLRRLDTDYVDFYHMWGINWKTFEELIMAPNGPMAAAERLREDGIIRHISFSFHDKPEALLRIIDSGRFESILVQYNILDRANEPGIEHARRRGLGVAIMGSVGGGRLAAPSARIRSMLAGGTKTTSEMALRFVMSNPNVSTALSGMGTIQMVEENAAVASREEPLTAAERQKVQEILDENKRVCDLYCTGCKYCMPCPNDVDIPSIFELVNYYRVYGLEAYAREHYAGIVKSAKGADQCVECGECEEKCPQKIHIMDQLQEAHRTLCAE